MMQGMEDALNKLKTKQIQALGATPDQEKLAEILSVRPRFEKLAVKDAKLRTFIADDNSRGLMVPHIYDVTYGIVENNVDTIVLIDDSIVRGTTLKNSILRILATLQPKKIIVVSSAPQIRYPDCYGIDMSKMKNFAAFAALVELLHENNKEHLLEETYKRCKASALLPEKEMKNQVQELYNEFSYDEISEKIGEMLTPKDFKPEVKIIYQTVDALHEACPNHNGDWYFSGNYPTQGGVRIVNQAFVNYMEKIDARAYA